MKIPNAVYALLLEILLRLHVWYTAPNLYVFMEGVAGTGGEELLDSSWSVCFVKRD